MTPLTRNDVQSATQQLREVIVSRTLSRQDVANAFHSAMQCYSPQLCSRQDLQVVMDSARDKIYERLAGPLRDQQLLTKQLIAAIDALNRRIVQLEAKIDASQEAEYKSVLY